MKCVFNKLTKKFTGAAVRWDDPEITTDEIIIELPDVPDNTVRLNDTEDGLRPATQVEIDSEVEVNKAALAEQAASSPSLDAAIEEFSEILTTASISIPANVKANITARIKTKL